MPRIRFTAIGLTTVAAIVIGGASSVVPAAAAPDALSTYVLPGRDVFPEGVTVRSGNYYVGSTSSGTIYRGDLRRRNAQVFIRGDAGAPEAVGLKATATRLVVAGGGTGTASVYSLSGGDRVARFSNGNGGKSNVNDVAIAPNGDAYLTDLFLSVIYRIPAGSLKRHQAGIQQLRVFLDLRGTRFPFLSLNANGIAVTSDGKYLLVAQFEAGQLYRIRLKDKRVDLVNLHGTKLAGPDGMVLTEANVLYLVESHASRIAEIRLDQAYLSGQLASRTTSPRFQCPTTDAIAGDRLLVVNSQFCGPGTPPFTVASIPLP
jgi:Cu-Zn family superoxide dismutase